MPFDDDEADEPIIGGLPDPSTRHWRHPSELSQLRPISEPPPSATSALRAWPLGGVLGGFVVLASVGLLGLGLASQTNSVATVSGRQALDPGADDSTARFGFGNRSFDMAQTTTTSPAIIDQHTPSILPTMAPPSGPRSTIASMPLTTLGPASTNADLARPEGPAARPVDPVAPSGLVLLHDGSGPGAPAIARATMVDGRLVTGADELSGSVAPHLFDGTWRPLDVVAVDQPTGLVVLAPGDGFPLVGTVVHRPDDQPLLEGDIVSVAQWTGPTRPPGQADVLNRSDPPAPVDGAAAGAEAGGVGTIESGAWSPDERPVFSRSRPVRLTNGRAVYEPIQTAIPASPMQAGAPLLDRDGRLSGVVLSSATSYVVALPIDRVADLVASTGGESNRPWWSDRSIAATTDGTGLVVDEIPDGARRADDGGLESGDRIVAVGQGARATEPVEGRADARDLVIHFLRSADPERPVTIVVERQGREIEVRLGPAG